MTSPMVLNPNLDVADFHQSRATEGMYFHKSDERYFGRKPTTVRVVTLGPGQPVFRIVDSTHDERKWDRPWWTSKIGFARILDRVGPPEHGVVSTLTREAREYSAVKRVFGPRDELGWMVVRPGHQVRCFMGFGLPMIEDDGQVLESNIQLFIPNLSVNGFSQRFNYFTPVRSTQASEFRPHMLSALEEDGAEIWTGFKRLMPGEILTG